MCQRPGAFQASAKNLLLLGRFLASIWSDEFGSFRCIRKAVRSEVKERDSTEAPATMVHEMGRARHYAIGK